jgi:hypothetical protein
VHPDHPGASHLHDFTGHAGTTATLDTAQMPGSVTTCADPGDTAAYWFPSFYVDGVQVKPAFSNARYAANGKHDVQPFPAGLKIVAGNNSKAQWGCKGPKAPKNPHKATPIDCGAADLTVNVTFPDCWNGTQLDSADHRSHMAASKRGVCPVSHPIPVPQLQLKVHYGKNVPAGAYTISHESTLTSEFHADFVNGWDQQRLTALIDYCLNALGARVGPCNGEAAELQL